ncbi:MAG: cardiolipin synthase, partial [Thermicanus sp.]|nr:cardiolipin synthase [Thermicanus sp.]
SVWLSKKYKEELRRAGVEIYPFLPVTFPIIGRKLNYRYHRKIVIIDGKIGYLGGFNIGREYLGEQKKLGHWRDTHLRIRGEAVYSLQLLFLLDFEFVSKKSLNGWEYFPPVGTSEVRHLPIQIISSGPDSPHPIILHTYLIMIANAKERIWLATPYLIPDEAALVAMKMAALSGVDVRILIPDKPDHLFVYYATSSYLEELLKVGVKIYKYKNGFMHSKVLLCDDEIVSVGTANMDIRSFYLNFEVNALIYRREAVQKVAAQFEQDFQMSEFLDLETYQKRPWHRHFMESIARLFSPIM